MSYGFRRKFLTLSSSAKFLENQLKFDKVTESLKVGAFLIHSVDACCISYGYKTVPLI